MTALALGTMNFGKRTPTAESERIIARALELGIAVFDTANVYNDGESETILGRGLAGRRDRARIATKVGFGRVNGKPEGLSRAAIARAIDGSLARLGTDYVDIYYLHTPDHATPIEESLDAMGEVLRAGKARAWGISNYASWQILEMMHLADARGMPRPIIAQQIFNVLHRDLDVEYFAFAKKYGVHTTVYNPLAGGILSGKHGIAASPPPKGSRFENKLYVQRYWNDVVFERTGEVAAVAKDEGLSLLELAYAWVAGHAGIDSILVGPATVAHLDDAAAAVQKRVSPAGIEKLDALFRAWRGTDTMYRR